MALQFPNVSLKVRKIYRYNYILHRGFVTVTFFVYLIVTTRSLLYIIRGLIEYIHIYICITVVSTDANK